MRAITTIFNFGDRRAMQWLRLVVLACAAVAVSADRKAAAEPAATDYDVTIRCHPAVLYRGDELVVDFGSPHNNFDFGIWQLAAHLKGRDKLFLLSFQRRKNNHIPPTIPPQEFGSMRQIRLNPATARGSVSHWWRRPLKPPELIFTASGTYEILLSSALASNEDVPFGACWVDYVDQEKQAGAPLAGCGKRIAFGVARR